ncbi:MAG: hypothetical protein ACQETE_01630 [Bacteroidota bacterium]
MSLVAKKPKYLNGTELSGGDWKKNDPCKHVDKDCTGKIFGALKNCRAKRSKSKALCKQAKEQEQQREQFLEEKEELLQVAQDRVVSTAKTQQSASSAVMYALVGVGALIVIGGGTYVILKRKK